ncbi:MAG TPA: pitrilysin family protein [Planctomycetota bacterium]|nr:pitrilysin family protein [Planctomycetota bacterium]
MRLGRVAAAAGLAAAAAAAPPSPALAQDPAPPSIARDAASGVAEASLPNGLRILVLEKPGVPVVATLVAYRVGAVDERPGETGLAHYLEHMLFKGTKQIGKGQIDLLTFRGGGVNNAYTNCDFTAYWFTFEASRLRLALEIEADRMRNCTFVPKEFEAERGAVLNEMHAGHDAPGGRLYEEMDAASFVFHPYHHPVIGWQQEVESVPRSTVIGFYDRYYMPNNATLIVVGAVEAEEVVRLASEAFFDVKPGPTPPPVTEVEPPQRGEKRILVVEETDTPRLEASWHTCRVGDPDDFVLDVASTILGGGKSSRLYRRLVETDRTAVDVSCWNETRKFPGLLRVAVEGQQGADPRSIEAGIREEVARLVASGPTDREMEKAKNNLLARDVYSRETATGTADRIASVESSGNWRIFAEWPDRIRAVTAAQVKAALARYCVPRNMTVGWSVNEAQAALAVPSSAPPPSATPGAAGDESATTEGKPAPPEPAAEPAMARKAETPVEPDAKPTFRGGRERALDLTVPRGGGAVRIAPVVKKLPNGLTLILQKHGALPVVAFDLYIPAGQTVESKPGLAWLVGDLLDEGAGGKSSEQIAETLDFLGATLGTGAAGARARCLSKDADTVLDLLADVVLRPEFADTEIDKCRQSQLSEIAAEEDNPQIVGRKAFLETLYGSHPYGRLPRGDAASVATITRDEIVEHHRRWLAPDGAILAAAGDFDPEAMAAALEKRFGGWKASGAARPVMPELAPLTKPVRVERPMEGKNQSNVFIGSVAIRRSDPDWTALLVLDHVLGTAPGFSDRMSKDLRDEQGLAYSVSGNGSRSAAEEPGTWTGFIACLGADLPRAIDGVLGHVRRIRSEPVSDQELADAKSYLVGSQVFGFETTEQLAAELVRLQRFGLGFDWPAKFPAAVEAVTKENILRVAKRLLDPERMVTVVSGWTGSK